MKVTFSHLADGQTEVWIYPMQKGEGRAYSPRRRGRSLAGGPWASFHPHLCLLALLHHTFPKSVPKDGQIGMSLTVGGGDSDCFHSFERNGQLSSVCPLWLEQPALESADWLRSQAPESITPGLKLTPNCDLRELT